MKLSFPRRCAVFLSVTSAAMLACARSYVQVSATASLAGSPRPATFTSEQDHQNMMDQLGIKELRPAPSPRTANYDESKASPYPNLPDALTLNDGQKVTTPEVWWHERRPQIVEEFGRDVYGFVPRHMPKVTWKVTAVDHEMIGFRPVIAKQLVGHVDNSSYPLIKVNIRMMLVTPANAGKPVPVLMMFGPAGFPAPNEPSPHQLERVNAALKALMIKQDPSLKTVFAEHPAFQPARVPPFRFPHFNVDGGPPSTWEIIGDGWGFAELDPQSVQADNGAGLTRGIIGLCDRGEPRKPDQWGALRAWAWGASQGPDYLENDPAVDAKHVGIEGVSRYGKAALVTMAFDPRFAMVLVGSSGKGGATLLRRNFGESVANLAGVGEYHWMAGNFLKYDAFQATFGSMNSGDLPVDSHELIALCAPRLTFISYGIPSRGDAKWLDQRGSFVAAVAASPVFRLLGAKGLEVSGNYQTAKMPPVNDGLLDGQLAWRQDDGGHTDAPNMIYFLHWADKFMGHTPPAR
jgi:hypothetical protein